jgi:hypothetical protein
MIGVQGVGGLMDSGGSIICACPVDAGLMTCARVRARASCSAKHNVSIP